MGKGYRQGRLGEEIRKVISEMLLREVKDPRLSNGLISLSGVEVTSDGSYATCFVTYISTKKGEEAAAEEEEILEGLRSAKGLFKKEIGKQIKLRHIPELIFKMDHSLDYGRHIEEVIEKLGKENE
ncbi:MAG: 30S ribosome-binding factor RbfA [Clostridia bacterium]|nr:30S ribosome-binding factor RbfA [Clostridia bacterium]